MLSAFGMSIGMVVHVCAAALGLALVLRTTPWALTGIQLAGAAYLGYLAATTLRDARRTGIAGGGLPDRKLLRRAVLTNLTNPKVILFFAAFLPQFTRSGYGPVALQLLTLGVIFLLVGLLSDSAIGLSAGRAGKALSSGSRTSTALSIVAGLTFAALAVGLVAEAVA